MKIEEVIREIRVKKAIKQQVLADALHIDAAAISKIENGTREVKANELALIASALGVEVVDLVTYPEKYVPESQAKGRPVKAMLQIELTEEKQNQVFKLMFGENNLKILTE